MHNFKSKFLKCAGRNIHFLEGGSPDNDCVIIWHGVTGTCRDHVELSRRLSQYYHVICPDSIGCGLSDWIVDKNKDPSLIFYSEIARDLLRQLNIKECRWIGASKGGGLGIVLTNIMTECSITHLVINDIGPTLPDWMRTAAMKNIGCPPHFDSYQSFEENLRYTLSRGKLHLTDEKWQHLALTWSRRMDNGGVTFHNDPALAFQFSHHPEDFDLWHYYDNIKIPTLLIRGEYSIVDDFEAQEMQLRGPKCQIYQRPGGHISLMDDPKEQNMIMNFINKNIGEYYEQSYG
ncbi:MAG: alpha/beta hydrolase [Emcibacter sp.]|nr:alpha/beta hydrolase [Emcibacter sp.]